MTALDLLLDDLTAETVQLDGWVADLGPDSGAGGWATVTTPEGWTVAHQVAHLHWTDDTSLAAIEGGAAFDDVLQLAVADPAGFADAEARRIARTSPVDLLSRWRQGRADLVAALRAVPPGQKLAWFGPPMSATSMATARLMETWAHGHDVAESLGVEVPRTDRVRHVCHLGVRTRGFAHAVRGETAPEVDVRVELTAPSGELWTWGAEDAIDRVTGDAWDFALLATRRRRREDVDVQAVGAAADHWLDIAQTFAGQPGTDPLPLADR